MIMKSFLYTGVVFETNGSRLFACLLEARMRTMNEVDKSGRRGPDRPKACYTVLCLET